MATLYYEKDIDRAALETKTVAVVGYGSQGCAQARNLRDSGVNVLVAERAGCAAAHLAEEHGFTVHAAADAAAKADVVALLVPEQDQAKVYERDILPHLAENKALLFAHGFAVHYGQIVPPDNVDVVLLAPKAPGGAVRSEFERGAGVPCLAAVYRDFSGNALKIALAYGLAIGGGRGGAGIVESGFREETETTLFADQAVLAGGLPELLRSSFDTMVEAGYQPEAVYFGLVRQLRYVLSDSPGSSHSPFSDIAEYGGLTRAGRVVGGASREALHEILSEIQNGSFAREWLCEGLVGAPVLKRMRERAGDHAVETVGRKLRKA